MLNDFGRNSLKRVTESGQSEGGLPLEPTSSVRSNCAIAIVFGGVLLNLALLICFASLVAYQSGLFLTQIGNSRAAPKTPQVPISVGAPYPLAESVVHEASP